MKTAGRYRLRWLKVGMVICVLTWVFPLEVEAVKVVRDKAKKAEVSKEETQTDQSQKKLLKDVESQQKDSKTSDRRYDPWVDKNNDGVNDKLKNKQPPPIPRTKAAEQPKETKQDQTESVPAKKSDSTKSSTTGKVKRR